MLFSIPSSLPSPSMQTLNKAQLAFSAFRRRALTCVAGLALFGLGSVELMAQTVKCPSPVPKCATQKAPKKFTVTFSTTKGDFDIEVNRDWAPLGADRFYNLVVNGFFKDTGFFRVVPGFVVQFGIHADPAISKQWVDHKIKQDDDVKQSNKVGTVVFATSGPKSRTTQLFINYGNNAGLDAQGFSPFGQVSAEGMKVVEKIESKYKQTPNQGRIQAQGNGYLKKSFPDMDFIKSAKIKVKSS